LSIAPQFQLGVELGTERDSLLEALDENAYFGVRPAVAVEPQGSAQFVRRE
jgi:hypothetical protein